MHLISELDGLAYYCKLRSCATKLKAALADHLQLISSNVSNELATCHKEIRDQMSKLSDEVQNLVSRNNQLQKHIDSISTSLDDYCKVSYSQAAQQSATNNDHSVIHSQAPQVLVFMDEYLDCERCRHNLIIYGLKEPINVNSSERKADIRCVSDLIKSQFNIENINITKAHRLGKPHNGKTRPLLITLSDDLSRRYILQNAKCLRSNTTYKGVFISPDLTPKEREANKLLYQELKHRKEAGEANLIIRKGKIITSTCSTSDTAPANANTVTHTQN